MPSPIKYRKLWRLIKPYWFVGIISLCIFFVLAVSVYRLMIAKPHFVYARVKVSQGLWWASTNRAPAWFLPALKPKVTARSLAGAPVAEITRVRYYPYYQANQYDIYLELKLKVNGDLKSGNLNFNRASLAVGAPIELAFDQVELTGTVMKLSAKPFEECLVNKTLTVIKNNAYQWEYDALSIGDRYFDGSNQVLKILAKEVQDNPLYGLDPYGTTSERSTVGLFPQPRKTILLEVRVRACLNQGTYVYGEEQELRLGKAINFSTNNFYLQDYVITGIK